MRQIQSKGFYRTSGYTTKKTGKSWKIRKDWGTVPDWKTEQIWKLNAILQCYVPDDYTVVI